MKRTILMIIGIVALGLTIIPSVLVFMGTIPLETHYTLMFIGTVLWLATAPFWVGGKEA
jgi:hypothetical protein